MSDLQVVPVDSYNWPDLEALFESRGGPSYCWCTAWRPIAKGLSRSNKSDKKTSLKQTVESGTPVGLLGYIDNLPVAWCSIAPRYTYRELGGDHSLSNVWSLVCFFVKRSHRKQGFTQRLIQEAVDYARSQGAQYVEAYPVDPDSPSYRFMGSTPAFDKAGFAFCNRAGTRRNVMLKSVDE